MLTTRGRTIVATALAAATALGTMLIADPAQAVTTRIYKNVGHHNCIEAEGSGVRAAHLGLCDAERDDNTQKWEITNVDVAGTTNDVVRIKNVTHDTCLDSNGAGVHAAYLRGCNSARTFQLWEVFIVNGKRVFKSWGDWVDGRQHLCLVSDRALNTDAYMRTCDATDTEQQWSPLS